MSMNTSDDVKKIARHSSLLVSWGGLGQVLQYVSSNLVAFLASSSDSIRVAMLSAYERVLIFSEFLPIPFMLGLMFANTGPIAKLYNSEDIGVPYFKPWQMGIPAESVPFTIIFVGDFLYRLLNIFISVY
ncbi:hypothetical protein BB560_004679 [Smittium megazygosporum]|uniref:Uncharacterized protein n=1 Tax=Smittium megazygosporum TaxID=133381 RepID=A0A2T9Z8J6_9FUNG|nr:hypothetical protein BB560_004679 [Smittium megazygosporum]